MGACTPVIVAPNVFPQVYDCTSDTTVSITTVCNYVVTTPATCAAHYILNTVTGMCDWDGTGSLGGQCLPGQNFDAAHQCCSAQPGSAADYPICPLGTTLGSVLGNPVCVPNNQALNKPSQTEFVHVQDPATCTGGSIGACTPHRRLLQEVLPLWRFPDPKRLCLRLQPRLAPTEPVLQPSPPGEGFFIIPTHGALCLHSPKRSASIPPIPRSSACYLCPSPHGI